MIDELDNILSNIDLEEEKQDAKGQPGEPVPHLPVQRPATGRQAPNP